ncbi:hypothetical protein MKW92_032392, partial [Papaver armeniacum]
SLRRDPPLRNDDQQQGDVVMVLIACWNQTASHTSTSNTTPPRSFGTSSSHRHQDASFREALPKQVRAPAAFKSVRVTPTG